MGQPRFTAATLSQGAPISSRQFGRTSVTAAHRSCELLRGRSATREAAPVRHRGHRGIAGPSAYDLDIAGRRQRFPGPLAAYQGELFARVAQTERVSTSRLRKRERGIWPPAIGSTRCGTKTIRAAHRLHSLQPGQAWPCRARRRIAFFIIPSHGAARPLPQRLGRRRKDQESGFGER